MVAWLPALVGGAAALFGAGGANKAANAQAAAAQAQIDLSREQFDFLNDLQGGLYDDQRRDNAFAFNTAKRQANNAYTGQKDAATWLYGPGRTSSNNLSTALNTLFSNQQSAGERALKNTGAANQSDLLRGLRASTRLYQPAYDQGQNALAAYGYNLGIGDKPAGYTGLELSPGAQFLLEQGRKEVEGGAAGGGGLYSGNTLTELERLRQGAVATDRDNQMAQLFAMLGIGQGAAGNMADLRSAYDANVTGQRSATTQGVNALRAAYGDARAGNMTGTLDRNYGYGTNYANALSGAATGLAANQTAAAGQYAANQGTARVNRANLAGQASANYQNAAHDAYTSIGNAGAAGAIGTSNAITGGINNALQIYGMMGGGGFGGGQPAAGTNFLSNVYSRNQLPAVY